MPYLVADAVLAVAEADTVRRWRRPLPLHAQDVHTAAGEPGKLAFHAGRHA